MKNDDIVMRIREWLEIESKTSETAQALNEHMGILVKLLHRFIRGKGWSDQERDDLVSHSIMKLIGILDRFDEKRGTKPSTFIAKSLDGILLNYDRNKAKEEGSFRSRGKPRVLSYSLDRDLSGDAEDSKNHTLKNILGLQAQHIQM